MSTLEETKNFDVIIEYVNSSKGLNLSQESTDWVEIIQLIDSKNLKLNKANVESVLQRVDADGQNFLQVNFLGDDKLLLTDQLVGFKPINNYDLDMEKIPKVVTTPDMLSVIEAIEDSFESQHSHIEVEVLKKLYLSVLDGAEKIGFDVSKERAWITQFAMLNHRFSA